MISELTRENDQRKSNSTLPLLFLYVPSFPLSPPVEGATTIRRQRFRLKALPSLQSSRPLFFSSSIRIRSTAAIFCCFVVFFAFSVRNFASRVLPLFFLPLVCLCFCLAFSLFSVKSFFAPDEKKSARSKSSVFSHDATSNSTEEEVNHGETCVLFSILSSFFLPPLGGRAHARGLFSLTRVCFRERFFSLFFAVSKVSRSRAPDVIGLKRMTRETNRVY